MCFSFGKIIWIPSYFRTYLKKKDIYFSCFFNTRESSMVRIVDEYDKPSETPKYGVLYENKKGEITFSTN